MPNLDQLFAGYRSNHAANETAFWSAVQAHIRKRISNMWSIDQDELGQQILVAVFESLPSFDGQAFSHWLNRFISHKKFEAIGNYKKKTLVYENQIPITEDGLQLEPAPDDQPEPILAIPGSIQGKDRNLCELILQGFRFADIADLWGCSVSAVKMRAARLRKKLRSGM